MRRGHALLRQAHRRDVLGLLGAARIRPSLGCGTGTDALESSTPMGDPPRPPAATETWPA